MVSRHQLLGGSVKYSLKSGLEAKHLWEGSGVGGGIEIEVRFRDDRGERQHMCWPWDYVSFLCSPGPGLKYDFELYMCVICVSLLFIFWSS